MGLWHDNLDYAAQWAKEVPIDIPLKSQSDYALKALTDHVVLLYNNPLSFGLPKRVKYRFIRSTLRLYRELISIRGFIGAQKLLKDLGNDFLRSFVKVPGSSQSEFRPNESLTQSPIYSTIMSIIKSEKRDYRLIQWIYTWHVFLTKIPLDRPDLEFPALGAWLDTQSDTRKFIVPNSFYVDCVRSVITWLYQPSDDFFLGHHGPGSTASGAKSIAEKNLHYNPTLQTNELVPLHPVDREFVLLSEPEDDKYTAVPKDIGTLRPITQMPSAMQLAQQGLKEQLYLETEDPYYDNPIRLFVKYSDQTRAQKLALKGSENVLTDDLPATTDLSKASDRISVDLIASVFSGNLLHMIMCGRSWKCKTEFGVVEYGMYAGMGSALTFPIQSMLFTSIAITATVLALWERDLGIAPEEPAEVLNEYLDYDGFRRPFASYGKAIQCYGDDIITPDIAVPYLHKLLVHMGLVVNEDKSFWGSSAVRESCGIFALDGVDITPIRYRIPPTNNGGMLDFAAYEGLRSLINRSFHYGYGQLYRSLVRQLKSSDLFVRKSSGRTPKILWEFPRGDVDYIGFISLKPSQPDTMIRVFYSAKAAEQNWGTVKRGFLTYIPSPKVESDVESEFYHMKQSIEHMAVRTRRDSRSPLKQAGFYASLAKLTRLPEAHGMITRGIRLSKRYAIPINVIVNGKPVMAWGWAPKWVK